MYAIMKKKLKLFLSIISGNYIIQKQHYLFKLILKLYLKMAFTVFIGRN